LGGYGAGEPWHFAYEEKTMLTVARQILHLARRGSLVLACVIATGSTVGCSSDDDDDGADGVDDGDDSGDDSGESSLSFFVSSSTQDGNMGGLEGADAICQGLADDVGAGDRTWRAYLSAENDGSPIHARDRIGTGPWFNALDVMLAADLAELHTLTGDPDLFLTEDGEKVDGQWNSASVNEHDIVTGSDSQGMLLVVEGETTTCDDWTSNTLTPGPQVGHTDGMGPGMDTSMARYTSWNGGHATRGCSAADLAMTGSTGRIYCFAAD
jgi:hypothetical protein